MLRVAVAALTVVVFTILTFAQQQPSEVPTPIPIRETAAVAAAQRALLALGSSSIRSVVLEGEVQLPEGSWVSAGRFVWKIAGDDYRFEAPIPGGVRVLVSNGGRPSVISDNRSQRLRPTMVASLFAFHLPMLPLDKHLSNGRSTFLVLGSGTVRERPCTVVRLSLVSDPEHTGRPSQDWFFDNETGLPVRVEYKLLELIPTLEPKSASAEFSDFRTAAGLVIPHRVETYVEGHPESILVLKSVVFNVDIPPSEFMDTVGGEQ